MLLKFELLLCKLNTNTLLTNTMIIDNDMNYHKIMSKNNNNNNKMIKQYLFRVLRLMTSERVS